MSTLLMVGTRQDPAVHVVYIMPPALASGYIQSILTTIIEWQFNILKKTTFNDLTRGYINFQLDLGSQPWSNIPRHLIPLLKIKNKFLHHMPLK